MKLYSPKYYKDFVCIADKCSHSCCIGWEIDIDSKTLEKYKNLSHRYSKNILSSIDEKNTPHFKLNCGERCPHLNEKGLCEIILNVGEDYLCDICREHPRFYNNVSEHREVGIGMACEEACCIILNSDDYNVFVEMGEVDDDFESVDFDVIAHRDKIYKLLSDSSVPYNERLQNIYAKYNVSPSVLQNSQWQELISNLEYLDEAHKTLFLNYSSELFVLKEYEKYLERALAYFIFRHCSEAWDEEEFRCSLGFCLFCERLLASLSLAEGARVPKDIQRIAQIISEEIEYSEDNTEDIKLEFSFL